MARLVQSLKLLPSHSPASILVLWLWHIWSWGPVSFLATCNWKEISQKWFHLNWVLILWAITTRYLQAIKKRCISLKYKFVSSLCYFCRHFSSCSVCFIFNGILQGLVIDKSQENNMYLCTFGHVTDIGNCTGGVPLFYYLEFWMPWITLLSKYFETIQLYWFLK